jgi:tetratricopeptide (TPR) repeat protein
VRWLDAAFEKFKAAIDQNLRDRVYVSNQDVIQSYLGVAAVQMIRGRTEEALSIYVQVSEKYPDCEEAWNLAGVAYSNLGSFDLAEKSFQKAIAIRPTFAAAHFNLGNYYINRNEFARAVTPLRESLRIEPSNVQACLALATAYANLRQPQDAVRTLTDYLAHFPQAPGADRVRQALAQLR